MYLNENLYSKYIYICVSKKKKKTSIVLRLFTSVKLDAVLDDGVMMVGFVVVVVVVVFFLSSEEMVVEVPAHSPHPPFHRHRFRLHFLFRFVPKRKALEGKTLSCGAER